MIDQTIGMQNSWYLQFILTHGLVIQDEDSIRKVPALFRSS